MSNNMDRDKPELLTTKQKEEEEMKRELLDMKMYESWYTYKEMKEVLGFINESKKMANVGKDEKNAQKKLLHTSNECSPELVSKSNLAQELEIEDDSDVPRLIHPHKSNHTSPIHDRISSRNHDSHELTPATADSQNYLYRNKTLDNNDIFDNLHDNLNMRDNYSCNLNKYIPLKEKNVSQDSCNTNDADIKVDTHLNNSQKSERWQINPLDSCVSKNDVPLREPERPLVQDRMLFKLCKDAETSESFEKLLAALNMHLKQTAESWYSWQCTGDSKYQWGSPIQVEVAKSSSDRKSLTNSKTEENPMECTDIYNIERPNKRKSALVVSSSITSHSGSDEDDIVLKKKKTQPCELSNRVLRSQKELCINVAEKDQHLDNDNIRKNIIMETKNLDTEHKKCEYLSSELFPSYSKNIAPPNTRKCLNKKKKHNVSILADASSPYHSSEEQSAINIDCQDKNNILTDEEILLELEKDNSTRETKMSSENAEIKPLPIKGLSRRIKNECMILERIQMEKQKKMEIVKEEAQRKEEEEKRKREEFYKKQTEEREQRQKQREEREKFREEKSKKWKSIVKVKSQKQVSEENKKRMYSLHRQSENEMMFQDNTVSVTRKMDVMIDDVSNTVNCPICNQCFPSDKIETHAAECEQYVTDNEDENNVHFTRSRVAPVNTNNEEILECCVCLKYTTTNCTNYEQHVNICLQKQHPEELSPECTSTETDDILNSPVRSYIPISEQTDSEINYRRQFPSNSRTQIHSNKKRKL